MHLPIDCPHRRSGKNWRCASFSAGAAGMPCCRQTDGDIIETHVPKHGPLCQNMAHTTEEYRFIWNGSHRGHVMVQVGRGQNSVTLDWVHSSFRGGGQYWRPIEEAAWDRLVEAVAAANFWLLDPFDLYSMGLDGAWWTIEGRRRDAYHIVERWSPHGLLYDLGRTFFDLAGPPIADIRL